MTRLLSVDDLSISYQHDKRTLKGKAKDWQRVTHYVSFELERGETLALVGESGSGKTTTARAIIGLLPTNARIDTGSIHLNGQNITNWSPKRLQEIRGKIVSLIPQDPAGSLDPLMRIGEQIGEMFKIHQGLRRSDIKNKVLDLLEQVGINQPERQFRQYPHQLSGGMRQRVLIACAIAIRPQLIIADEPTSALDSTVQKRILKLIDRLRKEHGSSLLLVTHDLGVASDRADKIAVMNQGRLEEIGISDAVLGQPKSVYTRRLIASDPALLAPPVKVASTIMMTDIIKIENLVIDYGGEGVPRAVDNLSLTVKRGKTHAIVGESGSGKTSTIRALNRFIQPKSGRIMVDGTDIVSLKGEKLRVFRRRMQLVYQNPFGSLDPRMCVGDIIAEPLLNYRERGSYDKQERIKRAYQLLDEVELQRSLFDRRPQELSGGQCQRVAIARALVLEPEILVLDEAISALDVSVQAQILALLARLQRGKNLSYVFVSHDLAVVCQIADTISVMKGGQLVEDGSVEQIFTRPTQNYTKELIASIPGRRHALQQAYGSSQL